MFTQVTAYLMRAIVVLQILVCSILADFTANAQSHKIESDNFILTGDITAKTGERLVKDLEEYRQILFQLYKLPYQSEKTKVPILVLKTRSELVNVTGVDWASGVYARNMTGLGFTILSEEGKSVSAETRAIAFHEFTHHFFLTYINTMHRKWMSEGLAEYYSTFEKISDTEIVLGRVIPHYTPILEKPGWLILTDMISSVTNYPLFDHSTITFGASDAAFFYAQSWLMVHYFENHPEQQRKFDKYIDALSPEGYSDVEFSTIMGEDEYAFQDRLKAYAQSAKIMTNTRSVPVKLNPVTLKVTPLTEPDRALAIIEMMVITGEVIKGGSYLRTLFLLAETNPKNLEFIELLKLDLALAEEKYDIATQASAKILSKNPRQPKALLVKGLMDWQNALDKDIASEAEYKALVTELGAAQDTIYRASQLDPTNIQAKCLLAMTYESEILKLTSKGIDAAINCANHFSDHHYIGRIIFLAPILIKGGKLQEAEKILNAGISSDSAGIRSTAHSFMSDLEHARTKTKR